MPDPHHGRPLVDSSNLNRRSCRSRRVSRAAGGPDLTWASRLALTIPGHLPYSAGLFMLCVAWGLTTSMALYAIRTRRIEQHREWMLRSYTVTFAFVTYRLASTWLNRWI